jgi:TolB protein
MKKILSLLILIMIAPSLLYAGQGYLEVTGKTHKATPLAIAPAVSLQGGDDMKIAETIGEILRFDLTLAGPFSVIPGSTSTGTGGIRPGEFDFSPWRAIGAAYLIKSGYITSGDSLTLEFRFYDVTSGKSVMAKRYSGNRKEFRRMVHAFSDETMLAVTGEKGPFTGKIVCVSCAGNKEVTVMDYDGFNVHRITGNGSINLNPDISPDGRQVLYTSYKRGNPDLYRIAITGGPAARISSSKGINFTGAWSPDGSRIALSMSKDGDPDIYLISREGKQLAKLTNNEAIDISPSWSPDGSRLAFVSDRQGSPQIFVMNSDGSNVRRLTQSGAYNVSPSWSPKGDRIVYSRQQAGFQIYSISPDGSDDTQLTAEGRNENPRWSPDGRFITFSSNRGGKEAVYVMRSDGTGQTRVSRGKSADSQPVWSPRQ